MELLPFRYMSWAKAHSTRGRYRLHASGMPAATLESLGLGASDVLLSRPTPPLPDPGLAAAVAARYGVPEECVMPTCGTHHANFLLASTLAGPGTTVLCEEPNYEDLPGVFRAVGATVLPFRRRRENGWRLPVPEITAGVQAGATVVVTSDLHNPSGARILPDEFAALDGLGRDLGITILVDEVYRDFLATPFGSCFLPGGPFVATTSLTKVYGLGGLRIGWALADPEMVLRLRDLNDFVVVNLPAPSAAVALAAWERLPAVAAANREHGLRNLRIVRTWAAGRKDLLWVPPEAGISGFLEVPALRGKDDVAWVETLFEETEVGVVPGTMFFEPGSIRLSWGMGAEELREGLARLGGALDRLRG